MRTPCAEELGILPNYVNSFEFFRFRFHFRALDPVHFPAGKSANVVRGAFGMALRDAVPNTAYQRLFEPRSGQSSSPSGLADWPRPFVLRVAHLDGLTVAPAAAFYLDAHVFDLHQPALIHFATAFARFAEKGMGPGRGRAALECVEQLDLADAATVVHEIAGAPCRLDLDPEPTPRDRVTVQFLTPTELKSAGGVAERPEFSVLFGRLRDRLSNLRALYGAGPLEIEFRSLGERAAAIRLLTCDVEWEHVKRRSGRTGQVHSIGGFTGKAEYGGDLGEFLPWLRAARWVGVGRQTVWGKGDVRVVVSPFQGSTPGPA